ncbi:glucose-6-phosphate isomerase B [Gottschalkia acidurici 9a]|uniref:Glucose-6-phosphate isomerase n=1 Tax=Gottschalkia acidurici (strain ATCC 7906 / DSM 604 / BCRC 14475 / CIP 104303 / KCTC 5404 / NCIMB 10678 / 9a) TaxID=1128398 RepID=K0AUW2_GOTA9|nr:glucose-6-phosphate isomerase [Gottschalkia acidurici]AFS77668.1 glucose-6-phosphate isomerase B [Gottschalkia acidurici 9a]
MRSVEFDYSNSLIKEHEIVALKQQIDIIHDNIHNKVGIGNEYLGWVDYPINYDKKEFEDIKRVSEKIKQDSDIMIVIGIGGSYLGARAVIESLQHSFHDLLPKEKSNNTKILFVGNNLSSTYISELMESIEGKDISLNVISKSGTTTEPAIAFRVLRDYMKKIYGDRAKERIYVTTDKESGSLRQLAIQEGYQTFTIPDDIGGRYSVLTPVGLLPIAVAGVDIDRLMEGAYDAVKEYEEKDLHKNNCYKYAAIRNILNRRGKDIELLATHEFSLHFFSEWWKQLFGETEGKDGRGIFPASICYTTDLHSLGQYIQDGRRNIFETLINIEKPKKEIYMFEDSDNIDELNYLSGKSIDFICKRAMEGTIKAHVSGGVPNLIVNVPKIDEYYIGQLIYFFQKSCAVSGYLLGINPFNQPGVEEYKKNMFDLLEREYI